MEGIQHIDVILKESKTIDLLFFTVTRPLSCRMKTCIGCNICFFYQNEEKIKTNHEQNK